MGSQNRQLSYDDLLSRFQFFKENSYQLEKKLIFTEEMIGRLQTDLNIVSQEKERTLEKKKEAQRKILYYEGLLKKMRLGLDEKEKQIETFCNEEKRLTLKDLDKDKKDFQNENPLQQINHPIPSFPRKDDNNILKPDIVKNACTAYFDYSVTNYGNKAGLIKGAFFIENTGKQPLEDPYVCLRFTSNAAENKTGENLLHKKITHNIGGLTDPQWMFLEADWAKTAEERGEVWIRPIHQTIVMPGESCSIRDYRILVEKDITDSIKIEAFVYLNKKKFKIKALNRIVVQLRPYCKKCMKRYFPKPSNYEDGSAASSFNSYQS